MESASTTRKMELPAHPVNGVTGGVDWASTDHAVSVVDDRGREVARKVVEHTTGGLRALTTFLARHGVGEVAIERGDGPVVDTLITAGITVVVISPNQLKNLRSRYGSAGNKDDRFDAFVLADTLRTDRTRLRPLVPDTPADHDPARYRPGPPGPRQTPGRAQSPDAASLACLAGMTPSTRQSGKHKTVTFRWAVNKELRDAVCDFASDSRHANPWAAKIYNDALARLGVIWRCWQDQTPYNPAQHGALQALLNTPNAA